MDSERKSTSHASNRSFFVATRKDEFEKLSEMLRSGASANARDEHNLTPLIWAARKNSANCARLLLEAGADINAIDSTKANALIHGAMYNSVKVGALLIEKGIDLTHRDQWNRTALHNAGSHGAVEYYILVRRAMIQRGLILDEVPEIHNVPAFKEALMNEPQVPNRGFSNDAT